MQNSANKYFGKGKVLEKKSKYLVEKPNYLTLQNIYPLM